MKAYLSNALFSSADQMYNEYIAERIRKYFKDIELYVPQEQIVNNTFETSEMITESSLEVLLQSDFLVAVLDGVDIHSRVSAEIGVFYGTGKPIYGIFTDIRQNGRENELKINAFKEDGVENQFVHRDLFTIGLVKLSGGGVYFNIETILRTIKKGE